MKKLLKKTLKAVLPILLGGFILYWVYRDFDFGRVKTVLLHATNWWWMLYSLLFGVMSHVFRGWRWKQTLAPLNAHPKTNDCVDAIFVSYAANLILPRLGEVSRCGVLARYDNVSFAKSLGTVVTERLVDTLCILLIMGITFLLQMPVFFRFFEETGTKIPSLLHLVTSPWFYVVLFCIIGVAVLLYFLLRTLSFFEKVKGVVLNVWEGVMSLRKVKNIPLFILYTLLIWICYFYHFYITFYCFPFTEQLSYLAGLVMFVGGTFAVIVPTPNGAGSWHFAVITMMMLYGVNATDAGIFALIVHGIQTLLVIVLGIWGWMHLSLTNRTKSDKTVTKDAVK
ncbi:lysylphosphatidylglycerol synthase transmembrane domain-containing protein [Bacteroides heparinolyticus]|uniref:lysylphosphatidylglycerol synthase transmembrane domain-containing protein n=1 Tax=Prevotella heparinolytica TaxID=28113 RepID=UPI0035A14225